MVVSYVGSFKFDESKLRFVFLFTCFGYEFDNVGKMSPFLGTHSPKLNSQCVYPCLKLTLPFKNSVNNNFGKPKTSISPIRIISLNMGLNASILFNPGNLKVQTGRTTDQ